MPAWSKPRFRGSFSGGTYVQGSKSATTSSGGKAGVQQVVLDTSKLSTQAQINLAVAGGAQVESAKSGVQQVVLDLNKLPPQARANIEGMRNREALTITSAVATQPTMQRPATITTRPALSPTITPLGVDRVPTTAADYGRWFTEAAKAQAASKPSTRQEQFNSWVADQLRGKQTLGRMSQQAALENVVETPAQARARIEKYVKRKQEPETKFLEKYAPGVQGVREKFTPEAIEYRKNVVLAKSGNKLFEANLAAARLRSLTGSPAQRAKDLGTVIEGFGTGAALGLSASLLGQVLPKVVGGATNPKKTAAVIAAAAVATGTQVGGFYKGRYQEWKPISPAAGVAAGVLETPTALLAVTIGRPIKEAYKAAKTGDIRPAAQFAGDVGFFAGLGYMAPKIPGPIGKSAKAINAASDRVAAGVVQGIQILSPLDVRVNLAAFKPGKAGVKAAAIAPKVRFQLKPPGSIPIEYIEPLARTTRVPPGIEIQKLQQGGFVQSRLGIPKGFRRGQLGFTFDPQIGTFTGAAGPVLQLTRVGNKLVYTTTEVPKSLRLSKAGRGEPIAVRVNLNTLEVQRLIGPGKGRSLTRSLSL
jgi:hypothetical protein